MHSTPFAEHRRFGRRQSGHLTSDYYEEEPHDSLGPRSVSLTALSQPRMVRLESLEAKMASIEVSLSRRRRSAPFRSVTSNPGTPAPRAPAPGTPGTPADDSAERRAFREKLSQIRAQARDKRATISRLKMAVQRVSVDENTDIDIKIQHAELELRLGGEELDLLTLVEEARRLQGKLDGDSQEIVHLTPSASSTVYKCVRDLGGKAALVSVDLERWDRGNTPPFGVGIRGTRTGLWVEWALSGTGLKRDDRVVEADGKLLVTAGHPADLGRLLSAPGIAVHRLVVLRTLQHETVENSRLTQRISCLEERVRELLQTGTRRTGGGYVSEPVSDGPPRKPVRLSLQKNYEQTQQNRKRSHRGHRTVIDGHI